jgi:hypothetical protein
MPLKCVNCGSERLLICKQLDVILVLENAYFLDQSQIWYSICIPCMHVSSVGSCPVGSLPLV